MKDPYSVLGMDKTATPEELKERYYALREQYGEQRFKSGEEGNEGARKLQELEEAWNRINATVEHDTVTASFNGDYSIIDELIRQGKYNEAQDMLDSIQDRNGEWHYMQSIVFYKREWLTESKAQLEMALREDPNNPKYKSSLEKLNMVIGGPQRPNQNANPNPNQQAQQNQGGYNGGYNNQQPTYDNPQDMSKCLLPDRLLVQCNALLLGFPIKFVRQSCYD